MITIQRKMAQCGVTLFLIGLITGIWSAAALTGKVFLPMPRLALAAHLNGLLGGLWLLAVAFTVPMLAYSERQARRLYCLVAVPAWGNWFITLVASWFGVNGLQYNLDMANNAIAFLLQTVVVLPSLVGSAYWLRGFLVAPKG